MADRTILAFPFVVDRTSLIYTTGIKIDWANVPADFVDTETGKKVIPAGTIVKKIGPHAFVPFDADAPLDDTIDAYVLISDAYEDDKRDLHGNYGAIVGGYLYANLLHDYRRGFTQLVDSLNNYKQFMTTTYVDNRA